MVLDMVRREKKAQSPRRRIPGRCIGDQSESKCASRIQGDYFFQFESKDVLHVNRQNLWCTPQPSLVLSKMYLIAAGHHCFDGTMQTQETELE